MIRTRVGYAGGIQKNPTYHNLGDHSETIQIDYDPAQISYRELLDVFWESHSPTSQSWSTQYLSIIFYHNEEQRLLAMETKAREMTRAGTIYTEIVPFTEFYLAEDYHQKHRLQSERYLVEEFNAMYPAGFVNSTAAARINGYLSGYGTFAQFQAELESFGLSPTASKKLMDTVRGWLR